MLRDGSCGTAACRRRLDGSCGTAAGGRRRNGPVAHAASERHRHKPSAVRYHAELAAPDPSLLASGASAIIGTTSVAALVGGHVVHRSEGPA